MKFWGFDTQHDVRMKKHETETERKGCMLYCVLIVLCHFISNKISQNITKVNCLVKGYISSFEK